jgi:phenylacetate-CoA ligase
MSTSVVLRELLEHARRHTAYYARLLPPAEQPLPEDIAGLFARLPLLSRREIQSSQAALRSVRADPAACWIVRSSGSTAEPVEVVVDQSSRAAEAEVLAAQADRMACDARWREHDWMHLALHPEASTRAIPSPWNPARNAVKWNLANAWQGPDESLRRALGHLHGAVVAGLPSVFELLAARLAASDGPPPRPALLLLSGEPMSAAAREDVARAFGCPVTMAYALAETGVVATECAAAGGYHAEPETALVEIVGTDGQAVDAGAEGELVLTPLHLRSMPLLRYRSGDRARWAPEPCGCGRGGRRFELHAGRHPTRLASATGATVHVLRFAKLLATLGLERYAWRQEADGAVALVYAANSPMAASVQSVVGAAVRAALGPGATVRCERVSREAVNDAGDLAPTRASGARAEPVAPDLESISAWLRETLRPEPGLIAAVLTGSGLDLHARTRFSDLDLVLLVDQAPLERRWLDLATRLGARQPGLQVAVDIPGGLSERAPLLACRLYSERLWVLGTASADLLPWPSDGALSAQARFWGQQTAAELWQRMVSGLGAEPDPVREAWLAGKRILQALRFRGLLQGARETAATAVLAAARCDPALPAGWLDDVVDLLEIAREQRPPPRPSVEEARRLLLTALWIVRRLAFGLDLARPRQK